MVEPITCVPSAALSMPEATAAAEPLLEPPGVRERSCGFLVPRGSVAIAMDMTCIYSLESPGGWHVLGRTPVQLFALDRDPPALLAAGDTVSFAPISLAEYHRLASAAGAALPEAPP